MAVYDAAAGTVTFTPAQLGNSTLKYGLIDEFGAASTITVKIHTIPLNDPPVAVDDGGYTTLEDQAIIIDPAGLLANDHDPNGDTITLAGLDRFARNGKVTLNTDGTITFTPRPNYNGDAGFHYQISDGQGGTAEGWVAINVLPVNHGATLRNDVVTNVQNTPLTILAGEAFGNDSDPEGDVLFFHTASILGQLNTKYLSKDVDFSALTVRGKALPDWLHFDATTMIFSGTSPDGLTTPIDVEVRTHDPANGNAFVHYFSFDSEDAAALASGIDVRDEVLSGYTIRSDFAQSFDYGPANFDAATSVAVTLADGTPLPAWLTFDSLTELLQGTPPEGATAFAVNVTYTHTGATPADTTS